MCLPKGLNGAFSKTHCPKTDSGVLLPTHELKERHRQTRRCTRKHTQYDTHERERWVWLAHLLPAPPLSPVTELTHTLTHTHARTHRSSITATLRCRSPWAWMSSDDLQQERGACVCVARVWSIGETHTRTHNAYVIKRSIGNISQKHTEKSSKQTMWNKKKFTNTRRHETRTRQSQRDVSVSSNTLLRTYRAGRRTQQRQASVTSSYWCCTSARHTLLIWKPVQITGACGAGYYLGGMGWSSSLGPSALPQLGTCQVSASVGIRRRR